MAVIEYEFTNNNIYVAMESDNFKYLKEYTYVEADNPYGYVIGSDDDRKVLEICGGLQLEDMYEINKKVANIRLIMKTVDMITDAIGDDELFGNTESNLLVDAVNIKNVEKLIKAVNEIVSEDFKNMKVHIVFVLNTDKLEQIDSNREKFIRKASLDERQFICSQYILEYADNETEDTCEEINEQTDFSNYSEGELLDLLMMYNRAIATIANELEWREFYRYMES